MDKVQGRITEIQQVLSVQVGEIDQLESLTASNAESISQKVKRVGLAWDIEVLKNGDSWLAKFTFLMEDLIKKYKKKESSLPCKA